jgi:2-polyprenyl-6-methoxyphenol hydroxylase-like FAD-dependent oxidoreductase
MRQPTTAIIGAGPAGLVAGAGLARRGHRVVLVDRDPGPAADGSWPRRGVMQFHHAHFFRPQVLSAVQAEVPDGYRRMLQAGGDPTTIPTPDGPQLVGMRIRRETFETALRTAVLRTPGVTVMQGHVDGVLQRHGRAAGLLVDGHELEADLVLDCSGRSGRATAALGERATIGGDCGIAYVDRVYRLRPGAEPGPLTNAIVWQADFDGFMVLIFVHEQPLFSVLIIRPTDRRDLVGLRESRAFEAACRAIPGLDQWTDPERSEPISPVYPGGRLRNTYRSQTTEDGALVLPGLVFVGDAVCTTTPNYGRGVTTSMLQVQQLLRLVEEHGADSEAIGRAFDVWCLRQMRPWVDDHVRMDAASVRRWSGGGIDLEQRLPSDLILAASAVEPRIRSAIKPYLSMTGLPDCLDPVEPLAREVYRSGWRPPFSPGPSRDELAEIVAAA